MGKSSMGPAADAYYTPPNLAKEMVESVSTEPDCVLDPSFGEGALLAAARVRWPDAHLIGTDIDSRKIRSAEVAHPDWSVGRLNMHSRHSRAASQLWGRADSSISLVLMNPPFSYRGAAARPVGLGARNFQVSPAAAFVGWSLSRLAPNGELRAVLPANALELEKDEGFWQAVRERWHVELLNSFPSTAFRGTRTRSALVAVKPRDALVKVALQPSGTSLSECVEIVRGRVPVHSLGNAVSATASAPFLHTRDLISVGEGLVGGKVARTELATQGPFVTLPRVGRALPHHIRVIDSPLAVVLSDCVFALRTATDDSLHRLHLQLRSDIERVQSKYSGGCAPYLTIKRLSDLLRAHGYCPHHVSASAPNRLAELNSSSDACEHHATSPAMRALTA